MKKVTTNERLRLTKMKNREESVVEEDIRNRKKINSNSKMAIKIQKKVRLIRRNHKWKMMMRILRC